MTMTADGRPLGDLAPDDAAGDTGQHRADDATTEPASGAGDGAPAARRPLWRRIAAWVTTTLAGVLVAFALIAPNDFNNVTPVWFVRLPVEGIVIAAVLLVLPGRARGILATLVGVALGLLTIVKVLDIGFFAVLYRPFDLVLDWAFVQFGAEFVASTMGQGVAIGIGAGAVVGSLAVLIFMPLAVRRLTRIAIRHRTVTTAAVRVLVVVWLICAVLGVQIVPGQPVASTTAADQTYEHARQVPVGLRDQQEFAAAAAADAFRDTPGDQLLTALRGKDVVVAFVESYGRDAIEDPEYAQQVGAVLEDGNRRLRAAGLSARSGFLTSPTAGGGSWLAHATMLSGLWIDNQLRYRTLVTTDRLTLNGAFRRADWRTVGVMPGITRAWPEGAYFGYDQIYAASDLGYRGPRFGYATMPDQYTLSAFERRERATDGHAPVMIETALVSSHVPWAPVPEFLDWADIGDGSIYHTMPSGGEDTDTNVWADPSRARTDYRRSIEYSINSLVSYAETYGGDDLVLVFLGDHQPARIITGDTTNRDVPITIVARDPAVLERVSAWGWEDGIKPGPQAPVWPMNEFRDRFLIAFGSQPAPAR